MPARRVEIVRAPLNQIGAGAAWGSSEFAASALRQLFGAGRMG
jgi:hypothetical protein